MSETLVPSGSVRAAAALALLALLLSNAGCGIGADLDPRPTGSVEDVLALPERGDTNLMFILIDTLRADRLGAYGYERDTSPAIDRLAESGVRFDRHLAQSSWTKASMASLWTGMNPTRTGVTRFDDVIPEEARMPAEILGEHGFLTGGIWRNGWVSDKFGFSQGFRAYTRPVPTPVPPRLRIENPTLVSRGTDEELLLATVEFLRIHADERWFLYLHLMDLHEYVYDEETALFGGTYSDIYDNSIRRVDSVVGALMGYLAEFGEADQTIVAIGSDHGEAFLERGLEGHARQVYRETTEVPLIVGFPFRLEPGVVVEQRSRNIDLWPTLLELVGAPPLPGADGRSLLPDVVAAARGEAPPEADRTGIAHLDQTWGNQEQESRPTIAVSDGPLRYVRRLEPKATIEQLFDASRDPRELTNVAPEEQASLERLRGVAEQQLEVEPPWSEAPKRELGELELNQLRALGYALP